MRFGPGGKGGTFLVANMKPVDGLQAPQGVGEAVERVAHDTIDSFHAALASASAI